MLDLHELCFGHDRCFVNSREIELVFTFDSEVVFTNACDDLLLHVWTCSSTLLLKVLLLAPLRLLVVFAEAVMLVVLQALLPPSTVNFDLVSALELRCLHQ